MVTAEVFRYQNSWLATVYICTQLNELWSYAHALSSDGDITTTYFFAPNPRLSITLVL